MATCRGLRQIFDSPAPENPGMVDAISSWGQINALKPVEAATFTDIFGELHFQEKPGPLLPPRPAQLDRSASPDPPPGGIKPASNGWSSESLQLCTEGLGFESSADGDDLVKDSSDCGAEGWKARLPRSCSDVRRREGFPPPITSMGRSGVCFRSYREGGRFVLREIRVPTQEFLHASREDGRLKLHFVHQSEYRDEEEEEEEQGVEGGIQEEKTREEMVRGDGEQ